MMHLGIANKIHNIGEKLGLKKNTESTEQDFMGYFQRHCHEFFSRISYKTNMKLNVSTAKLSNNNSKGNMIGENESKIDIYPTRETANNGIDNNIDNNDKHINNNKYISNNRYIDNDRHIHNARNTHNDKNIHNDKNAHNDRANDNNRAYDNKSDREITRQNRADKNPDSGQDGSESKASCVDGCVNGFRPGASTEAAVNAKLSKLKEIMSESEQAGTNTTLAKLQNSKKDGADSQIGGELDKFNQMIEQLVAQIKSNKEDVKNNFDIKISAKIIDKMKIPLQQVSHLSAQKVIFDTGLAEHFVRLLTDEFDKIYSKSANDNANIDNLSNITGNHQESKISGNIAANKTSAGNAPSIVVRTDELPEALNRALQIIRTNVGLRHSRLTVHLNPPDLGRMRIDIKLVDNNLHLHIVTETASAKELLTDRADVLRLSLERQQINISRFEIATRHQTNNTHQPFEQYYEQGHNGGEGRQEFREERQSNENDTDNQSSESSDSKLESVDELMNMVA